MIIVNRWVIQEPNRGDQNIIQLRISHSLRGCGE